MINEKPLAEKEYVVVFRSNQAINIQCVDVRTKEGWLTLEGARGQTILTAPAEIVLMVLEKEEYGRMVEAAKLAAEQQAVSASLKVDPQGIIDDTTRIVQPTAGM